MKLIGITGKSGSGKTTLSKMLERDNSIGVIHLDEVLDIKNIKEKMPNSIVDKNLEVNEQGEKFIALTGKAKIIRDRMIKNSLLRYFYYKALHLPRKINLQRVLNSQKKAGKTSVIVERSFFRRFFNL